MKLQDVKTYEELETYLREFHTFTGDESVYDFGGALHLWLALLDSLRQRGLDAELEQYAETLSPEQVEYLRRIVASAERSEHSD